MNPTEVKVATLINRKKTFLFMEMVMDQSITKSRNQTKRHEESRRLNKIILNQI